jgi:acyl-CoA synthetase (AMP-forming)/AMP-acid ligase II
MIPTRIYHFDQLPLNVNGKIDRRQIAEQLRQMNAPAAARAPMNS